MSTLPFCRFFSIATSASRLALDEEFEKAKGCKVFDSGVPRVDVPKWEMKFWDSRSAAQGGGAN
jgi:hypothetical protein